MDSKTLMEYKKEAKEYLKLGATHNDTELKGYAVSILNAIDADDETPGLADFLWRSHVFPSLDLARKKAAYYKECKCVEAFNILYSEKGALRANA